VVVYRDVGVLCMMMMPNGIGANLPVVHWTCKECPQEVVYIEHVDLFLCCFADIRSRK
jgi:hypothetical protein